MTKWKGTPPPSQPKGTRVGDLTLSYAFSRKGPDPTSARISYLSRIQRPSTELELDLELKLDLERCILIGAR